VSISTVGRAVLLGNSGANQINVDQCGTPLTIFGNGGSDGILVTGSFIGAFRPDVTFDGGAGLDSINTSTTASTPAKITLATSVQDLQAVSINAGATLVVPSQSTADINFSFSLNGVVDMAGGALVYHNAASQLALFGTRITNGYANGAWNGTASPSINSSLAATAARQDGVGYAPGQSVFSSFPASFAGVNVGPNDMLARYTLYGDANLDGTVSLPDFNRLSTNFGSAGKRWSDGDFNFDGNVNLADFNLLAANFGLSAASSWSEHWRTSDRAVLDQIWQASS
jgi:hypothetical protein